MTINVISLVVTLYIAKFVVSKQCYISMKNYSREQEMREFYIHEKYILSNFDLNSVTQYNATLPELKIVKKNLSNFRKRIRVKDIKIFSEVKLFVTFEYEVRNKLVDSGSYYGD